MNIKTVLDIKSHIKNVRKNLILTNTIWSFLLITSMFLSGSLTHFFITQHHEHALGVSFLFFLGFMVFSLGTLLCGIVSIVSLKDFVSSVLNKQSINDFKIALSEKESVFHEINFYKNNESILKLLVATSITLLKFKNSQPIVLSNIEEVKSQLSYNESILEQTQFHLAPVAIQEKINKNSENINYRLALCLHEINQFKLYNNEEFKDLITQTSLDKCFIKLLTLEDKAQIKLKNEQQKESELRESEELEIQKLEKHFNDKFNSKVEASPHVKLFERKEQKKSLSL